MKLLEKTLKSELYLLDSGEVMKWYFSSTAAEIVEREYISNLLLYQAGFQCVKPLKNFVKHRRAAIILPFINGKNLGNSMLSQPWKITKYGKKMADLHFRLHQIKSINLPQKLPLLPQIIRQSAANLKEYQTPILKLLSALPKKDPYCCHGDFHPYNIMISSKQCLVIDWENAYSGDPISDVARTALILESPYWSQDMPSWLVPLSRAGGNLLRKTYLRNYLKLSGCDPKRLQDWRLLQAVARLEENIPGESSWLNQIIVDYFNKSNYSASPSVPL